MFLGHQSSRQNRNDPTMSSRWEAFVMPSPSATYTLDAEYREFPGATTFVGKGARWAPVCCSYIIRKRRRCTCQWKLVVLDGVQLKKSPLQPMLLDWYRPPMMYSFSLAGIQRFYSRDVNVVIIWQWHTSNDGDGIFCSRYTFSSQIRTRFNNLRRPKNCRIIINIDCRILYRKNGARRQSKLRMRPAASAFNVSVLTFIQRISFMGP